MTDKARLFESDPDQVSWMDAAYSRDRDPETSHEAAASISPETLRQSQTDVLALFRKFGLMSDHKMMPFAAILRQSPSGLRTRRAELVKLGKLRWSGMYDTINGRKHRMWEVV